MHTHIHIWIYYICSIHTCTHICLNTHLSIFTVQIYVTNLYFIFLNLYVGDASLTNWTLVLQHKQTQRWDSPDTCVGTGLVRVLWRYCSCSITVVCVVLYTPIETVLQNCRFSAALFQTLRFAGILKRCVWLTCLRSRSVSNWW